MKPMMISPDTHKNLKVLAALRGKPMRQVLDDLIQQALLEHTKIGTIEITHVVNEKEATYQTLIRILKKEKQVESVTSLANRLGASRTATRKLLNRAQEEALVRYEPGGQGLSTRIVYIGQ